MAGQVGSTAEISGLLASEPSSLKWVLTLVQLESHHVFIYPQQLLVSAVQEQ